MMCCLLLSTCYSADQKSLPRSTVRQMKPHRSILIQFTLGTVNLQTNEIFQHSLLAEVSFQWKNPGFLLRNPDFKIRNSDFLSTNVLMY